MDSKEKLDYNCVLAEHMAVSYVHLKILGKRIMFTVQYSLSAYKRK